jgi:hypothetical protein
MCNCLANELVTGSTIFCDGETLKAVFTYLKVRNDRLPDGRSVVVLSRGNNFFEVSVV